MPIRISTSLGEASFQDDLGLLFSRSHQLLIARHFEEAESYLLKAQKINPHSPSLYNLWGFLAYQKKDFKKAIKNFEKAVRLDPLYAQGWNNLGASYLASSRLSDAKAAFIKAVSLDPNLEDALENLRWIIDHFFAGSLKFPTLSACTIMKNEEENIYRLLASLRGQVDEMVVVDTGSTDRSVDVARSFGAQVYFYEWCEDFSAARNEALKRAQGEWILFLDADEEMHPEELKKLRLILAFSSYEAFMLPIKSFLDPEEKTQMLNYLVRVFKNQPEVRYRGRVHETVEGSLLELGKKIFKLQSVFIYHHGYKDSKRTNWKVFERNRKLLLREVEENLQNLTALSYLGRSYLLEGCLDEAKEFFRKVLSTASGFNFAVLTARLDLAWIALKEGNPDEALGHLNLLKQEEPYLPDLYYLMGLTFHSRGEYSQALKHFEQVFKVDYRKSKSLMIFFRISWVDLYQKMGECYLMGGDLQRARECFEKAVGLSGNDPDLLNNLGVAMVRLGERSSAEAYFKQALSVNPRHSEARSNLFRFFLEEGRIEEARSCLAEIKNFLAR